MNRFWNPEKIAPKMLAPGVTAKIASGEKMMFSLVTLAPDAVVPTHSHPHEQMGMMVSGTMEFTIAGETRVFSGNEMYLVPGRRARTRRRRVPGERWRWTPSRPPGRSTVKGPGSGPSAALSSRRPFSRASSSPPRPPTG